MVILVGILLVGFALPHPNHMPVKGATSADYHPDSFWYYPWGKSVTHKGVDIFHNKGTEVQAATYGLVVFRGTISMGGNVVLILGPKWRMFMSEANFSNCERLGQRRSAT